MAQERGTGSVLKVKHGMGRESTFYGGSIYLTQASQKNLTLARKSNMNKQSDKEYDYEVKQIYHKKWSLRQHLLRLKREKDNVTYLDGRNRGKPRSQWDTSVDDVIVRHTRRTEQHMPRRISKSQERLSENVVIHGDNKSPLGLSEPTRARLGTYGLYSSDDNSPLRIGGKHITMQERVSPNHTRITTRFPTIQNNQRISSTRSELTNRNRRPRLRYSSTTLLEQEMPPFLLGRRRLSRSLTDLSDFRKMQKDLQIPV